MAAKHLQVEEFAIINTKWVLQSHTQDSVDKQKNLIFPNTNNLIWVRADETSTRQISHEIYVLVYQWLWSGSSGLFITKEVPLSSFHCLIYHEDIDWSFTLTLQSIWNNRIQYVRHCLYSKYQDNVSLFSNWCRPGIRFWKGHCQNLPERGHFHNFEENGMSFLEICEGEVALVSQNWDRALRPDKPDKGWRGALRPLASWHSFISCPVNVE
jgi:hypothetical protein